MASRHDERYAFLVEWYDPNAQLMRQYMLLYFVDDGSVEMFDVKNRRMFLKRTQSINVRLEDLHIGGSINVYSRQLNIVDYADPFTKNKLDHMRERSLVAVPYGTNPGLLIDSIVKEGFSIHNLRMVNLPANREYINFRDNGKNVICMEVNGTDAVTRLQAFCDRLKSLHGEDAIYASNNVDRDLNKIFGPESRSKLKNTAKFNGNTLCIIKPHTVSSGFHGKIIDSIIEKGFEISAMEMFTVERANAEEFFEVYKGVVPEFNAMVSELISGSCIALEITKNGDQQVVEEFREVVGPSDPGIARYVRPNSLRATYGVDKVKNALHCTDLADDGGLETEYFFRILQPV